MPPRSPTIVGSAVETIVESSIASRSTSIRAPKMRRTRACGIGGVPAASVTGRPPPRAARERRKGPGARLRAASGRGDGRAPGRRARGAQAVECEGEVAPPGARGDLGGGLDDAAQRPDQGDQVAVGEVLAQAVGPGAVEHALDAPAQPPPHVVETRRPGSLEQRVPELEVRLLEQRDLLEEGDQRIPPGEGVEPVDEVCERRDVLLGERREQGQPVGEVPVERADPDPCLTGDRVERGVGTPLAEHCPGCRDEPGAIRGGISTERAIRCTAGTRER